jgi:glycosidase
MQKKLHILLCLLFASIAFGQVTITPNPFEVNQSITITVDINSTATDCDGITSPNKVYLHSGVGTDANPWTYVVGNWGQDDGVGEMTDMGGGLWQITITPETYYGLNATQAATITKMGMVFRNETGTQELKATGCSDFFFDVGAFQTTLVTPNSGSTTILTSGANLTITANNTGGSATYVLKANGSTINSNSGTSYSYTDTNITENKSYALEVTLGGTTITRTFSVVINPGTITENLPAGLEDGINYDANTSKATLVLDAPNKDFVYIAGSFNNWQPDGSYAMKKDGTTGKFWLEITGLTPGQNYTYQYWVVDETPIANSPALVKTADPYSTLVLSPFDDPFIPATTYPNLPTYPAGQEREVTVLQTGQTPYNWQVTNFVKPKKEDLIIYEVLIRDFDADRNYQDLIDRIDYFKDLNVNAIQLMPIMEFEGNESWGYNTSFHMALDKYYGTADKFKEFVDLCHQNGIAVILDIALNHAFGRNPMVRMWMNDPDGDGWGDPSSENPYFNQVATHSYSVGSDFNHQQARTQYYTERVVKHWIEEFNIDGFRWDLTKGFTQECTASDEGCTNGYRNDRVAILKQYADYSWSLDDTHYVIFEHLGQDNEEKEWADYRLNEGKGIMLWGKMTNEYNQLTMGFASSANINRMGHTSRGFNGKRLIGYAESHDEERLMYRNLQFGNTALSSHNVQDLNTALSRMSALGAASLTIPGPKMIWHFGALGMENSIFTCNNGTVNTPSDPAPGDCKLDTKPQPQWTDNWLGDPNRAKIYDDWARLIQLKIDEPVFEGDYAISPYINDIRQRIYIFDNSLPATDLKNVVILCNFSVADLTIVPDFPYTGTWYDLMDETGNTSINVTNTADPIAIPAGQFRIFGNQQSILSTEEFQNASNTLSLYPNPASDSFKLDKQVEEVQIYDIAGRQLKTFKGGFDAGHSFNVSELTNALYLVKIVSNQGTATKRLLIE